MEIFVLPQMVSSLIVSTLHKGLEYFEFAGCLKKFLFWKKIIWKSSFFVSKAKLKHTTVWFSDTVLIG